jgi:hypothetical protein
MRTFDCTPHEFLGLSPNGEQLRGALLSESKGRMSILQYPLSTQGGQKLKHLGWNR